MGKYIDLADRRFGRLVVIRRAEDHIQSNGRHRAMWTCKCDCGKEVAVAGDNLRGGLTQSCGCLQKERASKTCAKHLSTDSRLYNVWSAMKRRCCNHTVPEYLLYGGRGISICDEWKDDFGCFQSWAIENGYNPKANRSECTIDRVDVNGDYSPENCRFVSQQEQMNNVRYNHRLEYNGETHTIAEWARLYNMSYSKLSQRINRYGYTVEQALTQE